MPLCFSPETPAGGPDIGVAWLIIGILLTGFKRTKVKRVEGIGKRSSEMIDQM
jgi:hypothetical protein